MKKLIFAAGGVCVCAVILFVFAGSPVLAENERDFGRAVKAIRSETAAWNDIVPFEWEKVYTFSPYTPKQEIERIIGFKSKNITETVSEGMTRLLFVRGNKVVCDVCGYSGNLGYRVSFGAGDAAGGFQMIRYRDDAVFSVGRAEEILVLRRS